MTNVFTTRAGAAGLLAIALVAATNTANAQQIFTDVTAINGQAVGTLGVQDDFVVENGDFLTFSITGNVTGTSAGPYIFGTFFALDTVGPVGSVIGLQPSPFFTFNAPTRTGVFSQNGIVLEELQDPFSSPNTSFGPVAQVATFFITINALSETTFAYDTLAPSTPTLPSVPNTITNGETTDTIPLVTPPGSDTVRVIFPCSDADRAEEFGELDFFDYLDFLNDAEAQDPSADLFPVGNPDGTVDINDADEYDLLFEAGCP